MDAPLHLLFEKRSLSYDKFHPVTYFDAANASQKAELLLRRLGVRRNLVGFDYTVYMSVQVAANPSSLQLITKRLYRETAKQFHTTSIAVERAGPRP